MDNLSDEIGTNIGSLSVNATTDTTEKSNGRTTKTKSSNHVHGSGPVGSVSSHLVKQHGHVQHKQTQTSQSKTHNSTAAERSVETLLVALLTTNGRSHVGVHGNGHTDVTRENRSQRTKEVSKCSQKSLQNIILAPGDQGKDQNGKSSAKHKQNLVLSPQKSLGTNLNGRVDSLQSSSLIISRVLLSLAKTSLRLDRDALDHSVLPVGKH